MQRTVYNEYKRVHAMKFQAIATPNGLVANLYGPVEGRRHDSGMLADSAILPILEQYSFNPNGNQLCICGDLAYLRQPQLQTPFSNPQLNPQQAAYNTVMSKPRGGVELVFGDIANFFKFLDLLNIHTCMYGSMTSSYFN